MKKCIFLYRQRYLSYLVLLLLLWPTVMLAAQGNIQIKGKFSLKEAIRYIEETSDYTFFYKDSDLKDKSKKEINCSGTIEEVLKNLFNGSGVNYIIKGKEVIFKVANAQNAEQQQPKKRVITGTIIDGETKEPIIGASVWLKNSSSGTVTNLDGHYSLTIEGIGGVLEFSYIGMKKQEIAISNKNIIDVILNPDTKKLDEVVVVGYGRQKKESVVGAISSLDVGELNIPGSNISNVLAGQLAGVVSMQASGEPGKNSASDFYIRGIASFKGNSTPLVLVDGIERELDEVVVVGYGRQKKESVVGAISSLDVGELNIPGSNISNVLAGQLAGVVSMQASGEPGKNSASDFYIRGIASFKGNSTPLVLVDGIERELDLVDVDDIATFSILKDASASAVYGVRGANGVILITTKKGSEGKPRINVRAEMGFKTPTRMPQMANSVQWAEMYNEAKGLTGNGDGGYSSEAIQKYSDGSDPDLYPNVNWLDQMYRNLASSERVTLNLSGGGDICKYYVSGGFYNEGSIFRNAGDVYDYNSSIHYTKFNFRANMDFSVTPTTTFNVNLANIYESSWGPGATTSDIWGYAFNTSPNAFPVEYSDGTLSAPSAASGSNPWNLLVHSGYREQSWNSAQSLIGVTQKLDMITLGLTANIKFSWDASNNTLQVRSKTPPQFHATGRNEDGSLNYKTIYEGSNNLSYAAPVTVSKITTYMEGSLNYTRLFAQKHRIGALFLYNHKIYKLLTAENQKKSLPYKSQGLAGRLTYAYMDRYFAEFNMGYTGSENFARGHRFGFFPAYAIGWMVSSEKWFEPLTKVVNDLKLKASYGKVGNDDIGASRRWAYEPSVNTVTGWSYGKTANQTGTGYRVGEIENTNVSWEEATKVNAGIELRLFEKLKIQADYFYEERNGIFLARAGLPAIVGLTTTPYVNVGKAKVSGLDGTLEYQQQVGKVLLTGRGNFTFSRNQMLDNDEPDWEYKYQNSIGKPFGRNGAAQRKGFIALGFFESQAEIDNSPKQMFGEYRIGDVKYKDVNGDGKIDTYDQIAIGYTDLPEITYGFGLTAKWKNFDASVFFQGVARTSIYLAGTPLRPFSSDNMDRSAIYEDLYKYSWKTTNTPEQNASAKYPRLSYGAEAGSSNNSQSSTMWLRDRSFLRLKNAEIGYTLPKTWLNKTFIKSFRFYIAGTNLLTFSKFKLWDPELLDTTNGAKYPNNMTVTIGLNANF